MSQANVDIVRGSLDYFAETGEPELRILDPDVEIHDHDIPDADVYRGTKGFLRWLGDWGAAWSEFSMTPERFIDAGDKVVVIFLIKAKGKGSGLEVQRQDGMLWTMRDGKAIRVDYFNNEPQCLEAAGLT